jgi:CheY-like chemotaxis protein
VQARSGNEAVILCQQLLIDLFIADLAMPDMNGLELIRSLRGSHADLLVLAMSRNFPGSSSKPRNYVAQGTVTFIPTARRQF